MKADYTEFHPAGQPPRAVHPAGSKARVLLTSVFGPYAQDDEYGSRAMNPMELYHNQVTRTQGPFSLRMFHRSWGLMMIQSNIEAPCTLLDFPVLKRFIEEIRDNEYDIVGISGITPNLLKVKKMCELVRQYLPNATIVVGGHIANIPDLHKRIDADHCVKGEGVRWFRRFLGEDDQRPLRHPTIYSGIGTRNAGVTVKDRPGDVAATVIPSVGCPLGCNFCSTSAMFGGKGKFINFYETGDELFEIMCQLEREMKVHSFFVMDENFLLHRKRALRLLELMEKHDKAWALYVFSSANVLRSYTMDQLVRMGISWVWMGIEGRDSQYKKLQGIDTFELIKELQSHGIRVLGSTIIGLENHTPENIDEALDYAARHVTDFHQFMLYTPIPGTPLHAELSAKGMMKDESEYHVGDIHGQLIFNYRHPHINDEQSAEFMLRAFNRDFEANGPSTARITRTTLAGYRRYKNHPDARIRRRYAWEARELATTFAALVGGAKLYYRNNPAMYAKMSAILKDLCEEFGWKTRLCGAIGGRWLLRKLRQEEKRLAAGWTYEPPTFYERNEACADNPAAQPCRYVQPIAVPAPQRAAGARELVSIS
ncbi:MAG: cobalamin-dependent protein [Pirellulales bacterium]|nr:cobalamin-dependent protein [Pirellulales bacterium]